jgi:uncharacterized membrane protein
MVEKPSKLQPALIGGIIIGLLSSIPLINFANLCCCSWVLLGGIVAARLLINRSPALPVTTGDGAVVGVLAGIIGSLICLVVGVPLGLLTSRLVSTAFLDWLGEVIDNPILHEQLKQLVQQIQNQPLTEHLASALIGWLVNSVIYICFAMLGAIIGVALFEKRKQQPPPPEPTSFMEPPTNTP